MRAVPISATDFEFQVSFLWKTITTKKDSMATKGLKNCWALLAPIREGLGLTIFFQAFIPHSLHARNVLSALQAETCFIH